MILLMVNFVISGLIFSGESNPLIMWRNYFADFSCHYQLQKYPFDIQICSISLDVEKDSSEAVKIVDSIDSFQYLGF